MVVHVPDGFFNAAVSVSAGVVAAAGVAVCLRGAKRELDDRTAPMAGLVAAFVFAVQMLNFPVAAGTSGHLLGGALAAILVGPYTGVLCIAVVLLVQGLFFADGGLTALGVNITLMGLVTVLVGWAVFRVVTKVARGKSAVAVAAFLAALLSVPASALAFTLLFWVGGTAPIDIAAVAGAMGGVHLLIGIGEGLITATTVGAVLAVRPDLVYGYRGMAPALIVNGQPVAPAAAQPVKGGAGPFLLAGLGVTAILASVVSYFASSSPDGLESVAEEKGFIGQAGDHSLGAWGLAEYGEANGVPLWIVGLVGVGITLLVAGAIGYAVRRKKSAVEA
ncbi:energy-coupling factor ABC transporter permease [Nonomuraea soli]|uniref:Cobalt/nickel transport system permease protein n=1 Tax=Nonomuraea soli TaxID=1032476 RepID=A0A7W0HVI4_9ACTN|nr:cobalt/nickel transport system permease protein [Nonomuraea soli]